MPLASAEEVQRNILISEEYKILHSGEVLRFAQGYEISLRGFSSDAVLVEFYNNYRSPFFVGSVVLSEGETVFCYQIFDDENVLLLTLTLDHLYISSTQIIARFSYIYQFEDENTQYAEWVLKTAVLDEPITIPYTQVDPTQREPVEPPAQREPIESDMIYPPLVILIIGLTAAATTAAGFIFRKRVDEK